MSKTAQESGIAGVEVALDIHDSTKEAVSLLGCLSEDQQMIVTFTNVSCWVPAFVTPPSTLSTFRKHIKGCGRRTENDRQMKPELDLKQILYNINGSVSPGETLALMGPSGSGKTTLLSILGGRSPKTAVQEGSVLFNDSKLTKRIKRQIGYVLQDDLLYEALTVYETLHFAATLRLPPHMTRGERADRVENVIAALGLGQCRDTIIGGFLRRGISGGERKRVSVGENLLTEPSLLLLDEPTSGLDSTTARKLIGLLKELASGGRAIVTTIHQPSSSLYRQLSTVLLLSQGHIMYYGQGSAAGPWFTALGHPVPYGVNVADFMLDISSGEALPILEMKKSKDGSTQAEYTGEASRVRCIEISERYLEENPDGYVLDGVPSLESSINDESHGILADGLASSHKDVVRRLDSGRRSKEGSMKRLRSVTSIAASRPGASRWGASFTTQVSTLFIRAIKVRRFETLTIQDTLLFIIVGGISGLIWWQVGQSDTLVNAQQTLGLLFFESLFLAFRTMFNALFTFPSEHKMMLKERASGMYRLSAFYVARSAADLPMDCSIPSILVVLIYLMGGLRSGGYFFANWGTVMLNLLVAQAFGLLIGATVMQPKSAQTIAAVIMLTFMLVGGFYVQNIPSWISWIKWLGFMTYAYNLLAKIEFGGRTLYDCGGVDVSDPTTNSTCVPVTDKEAALGLFTNPDSPPWEVAVMFGYLIVLRIMVYYALRIKTSAGGPSNRR